MQLTLRNTILPMFGIAAGLGLATIQGCDVPDIAKECGLDIDCEAGGFIEGKANISGVASIDAFFGAAIDLNAKLKGLSGKIRGDLDAIALSLDLEAGATGAEIKAALELKIAANVDADIGFDLSFQPPKCEASVEASIAAAAECDVELEPGELSAKCEGSCDADLKVGASCEGEATLVCTGTAPGLNCEGECSGTCVAEASADGKCSGTCRGSCTVGASTMDGFEGKCDGQCDGECAVEVTAEAGCSGKCEGSCEYTAPGGGCEAGASAKCEASAGASIECSGSCEGKVEPPSVSAECEATVEAKADASIACTPPSLTFSFEANADLSAEAQADFRAWLEGFRVNFSSILAARAEGELIIAAAGKLGASAGAALNGAVMDLSTGGNLKAKFGARCALLELPVAAGALADSGGDLKVNVDASIEVIGAF